MTRQFRLLAGLSQDLAEAAGPVEIWDRARRALSELFSGARLVQAFCAEGTKLVALWDPSLDLLRTICPALRLDGAQARLSPELQKAFGSGGLTDAAASSFRVRTGRGPVMWAPIGDKGLFRGVLLVEGTAGRDLDEEDLQALISVAGQVAMVLRAQQTTRLEAPQRRRDLELATKIQRQFLPEIPPELQGFRLTAEYRPALEIGGDFYDVAVGPGGQLTAIIGDVSGKGIAAALIMSRVSSHFQRLATELMNPGAILAELNRTLVDKLPDGSFATAACVRLDARRGRLTVANAGHCQPLVRRAAGGVVLAGRNSGTPLGMLEGERYPNQEFVLSQGDIVLLTTDGVVDAFDPELSGRGSWRLTDLVADAPHDLEEIRRLVLEAVASSPVVARDDVALLAIQERTDPSPTRTG